MLNEKIIVLKEAELLKNISWSENFFTHSKQIILKNILTYGQEYDKELAENDTGYKQLVAYMIYRYKGKIFVMQRDKKNSCLDYKYSIGIGGHLTKDDIKKNFSLWGERELREEVAIKKAYKISFFGFINDNSNKIGKKHFGIVYLLEGNSPDISIASELKTGQLIQYSELDNIINKSESWSLLLINALKKKKIYKRKETIFNFI